VPDGTPTPRTFTRLVGQSGDEEEDRCNALLRLAGCHEAMGAAAAARDHCRMVLDAGSATDEERRQASEGLARLV
jgi:hypothetical protein